MRLVSLVIGLVAGILFWYFVAPSYAEAAKALAGWAAPHAFGRGFSFGVGENAILYRPDGSIAAKVFIRYVTSNVITLIALFATSRKPVSIGNIARIALALAGLIPLHAIAILVVAKSIVAPPGSLWESAAQGYVIFGAHAFSFAFWYLLRLGDDEGAPADATARKRKSRDS